MVFHTLARRYDKYEDRDRWLAGQAAAYLVAMLLTWLLAFITAYALLLHALGVPEARTAFHMLRTRLAP